MISLGQVVKALCRPFAPSEPMRMMIVMRNDLNMRKGKAAAQAGHVVADLVLRSLLTPRLWVWQIGSRAKICVKVQSEEELHAVFAKARSAGLGCSIVQDAGRTEFKEPTYTGCAIGPATEDELKPITGGLGLW